MRVRSGTQRCQQRRSPAHWRQQSGLRGSNSSVCRPRRSPSPLRTQRTPSAVHDRMQQRLTLRICGIRGAYAAAAAHAACAAHAHSRATSATLELKQRLYPYTRFIYTHSPAYVTLPRLTSLAPQAFTPATSIAFPRIPLARSLPTPPTPARTMGGKGIDHELTQQYTHLLSSLHLLARQSPASLHGSNRLLRSGLPQGLLDRVPCTWNSSPPGHVPRRLGTFHGPPLSDPPSGLVPHLAPPSCPRLRFGGVRGFFQ